MNEPTHATGRQRVTRHDYPDTSDVTSLPAVLRRTSWGAVVAGAIVAISAQILFTVLGIAIGATALDTRSDPSAQVQGGLDVTAAAWWMFTGTASLLLGGLVVGRFAGITRSPDLLLHGLTMWGVTAVFGFATLASASASLLYGTNIIAAFTGAQAASPSTMDSSRDIALVSDREPANFAERPQDEELAAAEKQAALDYVRGASWWTLVALVLGISASLAGSWLSAPERIVMRSPSVG